MGFQFANASGDDTAPLSKGKREWKQAGLSMIRNRQDYEKYVWPTPETVDYYPVEYVCKNIPDGMKVIPFTGGILEFVTWLTGFDAFSYLLIDEPELIGNLFRRVSDLIINIYRHFADMDNVGALWLGDDMGHKTGTLVSPTLLRKYVFPTYKKLVQIAHEHKYPFLLHSCGNLKEVMDDLINDVGIDGKHSYEDVFITVVEAKRKYGDRISILGGIDMNFLSRATVEEVRKYVRNVLDKCAPGGGYCLGTGNSIANYIKIENYLAMLDVGWNYAK